MDATRHRHLGGKRDTADSRDFRFAPALEKHAVPPAVDLREHCGVVYDQQPLQSCSANALSSLLTFVANKEKRPIEPPSRLFIYYNERKLEGTLPKDGGAQIRTGLKTVAKLGACSEKLWPYEPDNASTEPALECYKDAKATRALQYFRIAQDLDHLRACLADGYAFVFGMQAYLQGFEAAQHSGVVPMPASTDTLMGGHAVLAVGYDDRAKTVTVLNSLGKSWGSEGYFTLPYEFITNADLAYDFWTIRSVS